MVNAAYILSVFFATALLLKLHISIARSRGLGQMIKKDGPDLHGYKEGTPTMGGLVFIPVATLSMIFLKAHPLIIWSTAAFFLIGLLDDLSSFILKDAYGMKARWKFALQSLAAITLSYTLSSKTVLSFPHLAEIDMGKWYGLFAALVIVSTVNAVNITDGLDGLAGWTFTTTLLPMYIYTALKGNPEKSALVMIAAILAFLLYNSKPASVFMGDTGSLALGGYIAAFSIVHGLEIPLLMFGFIFVVETLSVIIQVASYKTRRKRVFKMAPIHHHFELSGWPESKIVMVFAAINLLAAIVAVGWSL